MNQHILISALASILAVSCNELADMNDPGLIPDQSGKVFGTKTASAANTLLVKVATGCDESVFSGIEHINGVEHLFNLTEGNSELESRFGLDRWFIVETDGNLDKVVSGIAALESVSVVEYDMLSSPESDGDVFPAEMAAAATEGLPFSDPMLKDQWHYINTGDMSICPDIYKGADINVKEVWSQLTCGDPEIIVAVVDHGVKYTHPDLKDNMWVNKGEIPGNGIDDDRNGYVDDVYGYNFVDSGALTWDGSGHGTHIAGTIAAVNNNGIGVCGGAGGSGKGDGCRIMSCQMFSKSGGGSVSETVNAIKYAADMGASILSCSFGYTSSMASDNDYLNRVGTAEYDAVHYFEAHGNNSVLDGNIAIFAAGNEGHNYAHYPGAMHDIISVSAFGPDYLPTYYTNYGPGCNIAAPGGEAYHSTTGFKSMILSTVPSEIPATTDTESNVTGADYGYMQGTSMACPHVSGIAALALSYAKKLGKTFTVDEFKRMLITSANDLDSYINKKDSKTYAYYMQPLSLGKYYHEMGTGSIDAWMLMMQIEGIPSILARTGENQWLSIDDYFGTASKSLTYIGVEVPESTRTSLGLEQEPYIQYGKLWIHPTECGSGKVRVKAVGGGSHIGGGDNPPGGMEISQEISIIARSFKSENGGWL